jgi:hypothetical protein
MSVQGFRTPEEVATFGSLMQGLADIVVGKYDGSLKVTIVSSYCMYNLLQKPSQGC